MAAALVLSPVVSRAAVVKGRTQGIQKLVNPVWNEAKEPTANRYTWREPSPTVRAEFRALFPFAPKEIAYYEPDPPAGCERASSNDVTIDDRGLVYLLDRQQGIDIIECFPG